MPAGRPSSYKDIYAKMLIEYFDIPSCTYEDVENSQGDIKRVIKPASLPTLAGFACKIGFHRETLLNWANDHEEFFDALKKAKDHQERILVENGLMGGYDKSFAIFTAKNLIDWRDKTETEHKGTVKIMASPLDEDL